VIQSDTKKDEQHRVSAHARRVKQVIDFNERSRVAYNAKADDYDNSREGQFARELQLLLLSQIRWSENQSILDVACGNGSLLASINERKPIRGYGIDISERMIANAIKKNPDMDFQVAGCEKIPFADNSMDIITVCAAYHHFPDTATFAKEAKRVLVSVGMVYVVDLYIPSFLRLILNPFVPLLLRDGDFRIYSPKDISRNFERFGFEGFNTMVKGNTQIVSLRIKS